MENWSDQMKLFSVLSSTKVLLETISKDDGWSFESPKKTLKIINESIAHFLNPDDKELPEDISMQFAPTGPLQDISNTYGWNQFFIKLSQQYDKYSYCFGEKKDF